MFKRTLAVAVAALSLTLAGCTVNGSVTCESADQNGVVTCKATPNNSSSASATASSTATSSPASPSATATTSPTSTTIPTNTPTASTSPTASQSTTVSPVTPTTKTPQPTTTSAPTTSEKRYTAYITGYDFYDNDPPNSAAIAYEDVVKTRTGAGGTGTFNDPTTIAVPDKLPDGQVHKPGDKFYIPNLQKYFIVEDLCAQSHANNYTDCTSHDVWVDGRWIGATASRNCMEKLTGDYLIIKNPASNYRVTNPGKISAACNTYGNTVFTQ